MKAQRTSTLAFAVLFPLLAMTFQAAARAGLPSSLDIGSNAPILASSSSTVISCPVVGTGSDRIARGFYVESYPGTNLGTVQVVYWTNDAGSYAVSMTVRSGTYDGTLVGTRVVTVEMPAATNITTTFDFGGAPVTPGTILTFAQVKVSGPGNLFYNTGPCSMGDMNCTACPGVYETEGITPPLDTIRRRSVGVTLTQAYRKYLPIVMK